MSSWVRGFVLGALKQSPATLDEYSMADVLDAYYGHRIDQQMSDRTSWETARFISFATLKSAGNKRLKKPSDLMVFDWEKKSEKKGTKGNGWTTQEIEQLKKERPKWFK